MKKRFPELLPSLEAARTHEVLAPCRSTRSIARSARPRLGSVPILP